MSIISNIDNMVGSGQECLARIKRKGKHFSRFTAAFHDRTSASSDRHQQVADQTGSTGTFGGTSSVMADGAWLFQNLHGRQPTAQEF